MTADWLETGSGERAGAGVATVAAAQRATHVRLVLARLAGLLVPIALYLLAIALLGVRIGSHPGFDYNWESYTARDMFTFWGHPSRAVFHLTDGLMTDSGRSPLMVLPIWLGFKLLGVGLTGMRVPIILIGAAAVPLTWLVGRRLVGTGTAALAAVLLALSPVYLLYGRTATLVGISLVPALLTIYALLRVLSAPRRWPWLIALQLMLAAGAYAYAPIRFLWLISLVLFAAEFLWRRGERLPFVICLIVTTVVLPLALVGAHRAAGDHTGPRAAVRQYYNGRGEQVLALDKDPQAYRYYLQLTPAEQESGKVTGTSKDLMVRLVRQNATDLTHLLLDIGTKPAITDYWNPQGRLLPRFLVPFFLLGMLISLWRARRRVEDRAWLALFWGFSLPLLLTSRVHIGRLIFVVPLLCLFVAFGFTELLRAAGAARMTSDAMIVRRGDRRRAMLEVTGESLPQGAAPSAANAEHVHSAVRPPSSPPLSLRSSPAARVVALAALAALIGAVAWSTWVDYRISPPVSHEALIAAELRREVGAVKATGGGAALVLATDPSQLDGDALTAGSLRLALDGEYRFVNLAPGQPTPALSPADPRPPLYTGGLLFGRLTQSATMPTFCQNVYFVAPPNLDRFRQVIAGAAAACPQPVRYVALPG